MSRTYDSPYRGWVIEPIEGTHDVMLIDKDAATLSRIRVQGPVLVETIVDLLDQNS